MTKRILVIQGHPTAGGGRFGHALADAYEAGAGEAGHETRCIAVAELAFPLLRSKEDWEHDQPPPAIAGARDDIAWAEHILVVFPLWLGDMPALLKGFFEQLMRPGLAGSSAKTFTPLSRPLAGRSARIVVTMGMPAFVYRWYFRGHGLRLLKRNVLGFVGIRPIRTSVIGSVEAVGDGKRTAWISRMRKLGGEAK